MASLQSLPFLSHSLPIRFLFVHASAVTIITESMAFVAVAGSEAPFRFIFCVFSVSNLIVRAFYPSIYFAVFLLLNEQKALCTGTNNYLLYGENGERTKGHGPSIQWKIEWDWFWCADKDYRSPRYKNLTTQLQQQTYNLAIEIGALLQFDSLFSALPWFGRLSKISKMV